MIKDSRELRIELWREHVERGNLLRLSARGRSMWPAIRSGDILLVSKAEKFGVGEILIYLREDTYFAHRLIGFHSQSGKSTQLILHGDAHRKKDRPVDERDVVGRVVALVRGDKRIDMESWPRRFRAKCSAFHVVQVVLLPLVTGTLIRVYQAIFRHPGRSN